jgi:hypothetical protein
MRSRVAIATTTLTLLLASSVCPSYAQKAPTYLTLSAGASWPVSGPVEESYKKPGVTFAGSFRTALTKDYMSGLEVGYSLLTLDHSKLADKTPGSVYSGGDLGLLSVTTENDYILGAPADVRPFISLGLGYFASFINDATVTTNSVATSYIPGVYEGSFFGLHGGAGLLVKRQRLGLRLEAVYQYIFSVGDDLQFLQARGGLIFYPSKPTS